MGCGRGASGLEHENEERELSFFVKSRAQEPPDVGAAKITMRAREFSNGGYANAEKHIAVAIFTGSGFEVAGASLRVFRVAEGGEPPANRWGGDRPIVRFVPSGGS